MSTDKHDDQTLDDTIHRYLMMVETSRSANTARAYRNAMNIFADVLSEYHLPVQETAPGELPENSIGWLANHLKVYASATERLYLTAVAGFFEYLAAEQLATPNLSRIRLLIRQRARRPGQRLPQFPQEDIATILVYTINLAFSSFKDDQERLRNLRDRAFLLTLADTGLRVHEACNLRRGDIDWNEGRAVIIGKGDRQAVIRFSTRSLSAVKDYLSARAAFDGASRKPLASLPLFARHDRGAGKKVKGITTTTGRNIVSQRVAEALGPQAVGSITPHSFRHYFVTIVLRGSGGNLKLAQDLARHRNIAVTQRYAHLTDDELDQGYREIFS